MVEIEKAIVQRIAIVQIINTTKSSLKIPGIVASCIFPPPEVTSHTLFKDSDVYGKTETSAAAVCGGSSTKLR